jgi:hypothetical protein
VSRWVWRHDTWPVSHSSDYAAWLGGRAELSCVLIPMTIPVQAVLESALMDYKGRYPNATDEEAVRHVLKHKLPASLPGTPAWHRSNLQDLLCMVDRFGMPSFFLTLTTDEVSETRWPEIDSLETKLQE